MESITIQELEDVINFWRRCRPASGEECALSQEVNCLADIYALMIIEKRPAVLLAEISGAARDLIEGACKEDAQACK